MVKFKSVKEKLSEMHIKPSMISLLILGLQIIFIAHLFACGWSYISLNNDATFVGTVSRTWATEFQLHTDPFFDDRSIYERYVACLYYILVTMLTVGYGDIHATNAVERAYAVVTMFVGSLVFGALVSKVGLWQAKMNPQALAIEDAMNELQMFLKERSFPTPLKISVKEAYSYYLSKTSLLDTMSTFKRLPKSVFAELISHVNMKELRQMLLFRQLLGSSCSQTDRAVFLHEVLSKCRPFKVPGSQTIFAHGDVCHDIIIVLKGYVTYSSGDAGDGVVTGVCRQWGYFGDFEYWKKMLSAATYSTVVPSELLAISHMNFDAALAESFTVVDVVKSELKSRYEAYREAARSAVVGGIGCSRSRQLLWVDGDLQPFNEVEEVLSRRLLKGVLDAESCRGTELSEADEGGQSCEDGLRKDVRWSLLFQPDGKWRVCWTTAICALITVMLWLVPVDIAFNEVCERDWMVLQTAIGYVLLFDILVCFNTARYCPSEDNFLQNRFAIARSYYRDSLLLDLIASVPLYHVAAWPIQNSASSTTLSALKFLKLPQLLLRFKRRRLLQEPNLLSRLEQSLPLSHTAISLVKLVFTMTYIAHIVACVWWALSSAISSQTWYENVEEVFTTSLADSVLYSKYSFSIYWAATTMTTVGYGDVVPQNTPERLLAIFILVCVATVFSSIINSVSQLLHNSSATETAKTEQMASIVEFLHDKKCPDDISNRVRSHFWHLFSQQSAYKEDKILSSLPPHLTNEILLIKHKAELLNIAIFRFVANKSVRLYLFSLMSPVFFDSGQDLLVEGQQSEAVLFLVTGQARAICRLTPLPPATMASSFKKSSISGRLRRGTSSIVFSSSRTKTDTMSPDNLRKLKRKTSQYKSKVHDPLQSKSDQMEVEIEDAKTCDESALSVLSLEATLQRPTPVTSRRLPAHRSVSMPVMSVSLFGSKPEYSAVAGSGSAAGSTSGSLDSILMMGLSSNNISSSSSESVAGTRLSVLEDNMVTPASPPAAPTVAMTNNTPPSPRDRLLEDAHGVKRLYDFYSHRSSSTGSVAGRGLQQGRNSQADPTSLAPSELPFSKWSQADTFQRGFRFIGDLFPGSFFGHVAMLQRQPHKVTVRAVESCVLYSLPLDTIRSLISEEPKVAIQLQRALSKAILLQETELAKYHMRENRASLLKAMRNMSVFQMTGNTGNTNVSGSESKAEGGGEGRKVWLWLRRRPTFFSCLPVSRGCSFRRDKKPLATKTLGHNVALRIRSVHNILPNSKLFYESDEDEPRRLDLGLGLAGLGGNQSSLSFGLMARKKHSSGSYSLVNSSSTQRDGKPHRKPAKSFARTPPTSSTSTPRLLVKAASNSCIIGSSDRIITRPRRQSHPSLENALWRERGLKQGVVV